MAQALDQTHQTLAGSCGRPCQLDPGLKYINKYLMCCCKILHFHVEGQKLITRTFLFPSHHRGVNICLGKWSSGWRMNEWKLKIKNNHIFTYTVKLLFLPCSSPSRQCASRWAGEFTHLMDLINGVQFQCSQVQKWSALLQTFRKVNGLWEIRSDFQSLLWSPVQLVTATHDWRISTVDLTAKQRI